MTQTFADVIERFGYAKLADALGRPEGTVSSWQSRNSIPPEVWPSLVEAAEKNGIDGVSFEALAAMAQRRAAQRRVSGARHDGEVAA